jgi:hypothetical protein
MADEYLFRKQNEQEEKKMNKKVLLVILAMTIIAGNAWAAEPEWFGSLDANGLGQSTNWFDPAMWQNPSAVPTSSDKAKINLVWGNPGPIINAAAPDVNQVYVAESSGALAGAQTLEVTTGGVLNVNAEVVLGYGSDDVNDDDGKLHVTGGTVNCKQHLFVGYDPCAIGRLEIDSGTVDVNQMFGLSWNGGIGYAQLDGGTLTTEEFTFENVAGGTAAMDITGGTWIQKHYWWEEIKSLVWNGKITGYGNRANVVVTWDPNVDDPNKDRVIVTALAAPAAPDLIIVKKAGTGDYDSIQDALDDVNGLGLAEFDVIEVRDNATYAENLVFPNDVNFLTLQAGSGFSPTIALSGTEPNTTYIFMRSRGQTIQGFNINLPACDNNDYTNIGADSNSTIILSDGGASTVRDCIITGPPATGWVRGITNVATIEDTEITDVRQGIICDLNEDDAGFRYSISGSHIHDTRFRGISFLDCNAVMDDCLVERCGGSLMDGYIGNCVRAADGNSAEPDGTLNLLITNSIIREALYGRNFVMNSIGTATIEDSMIMHSLGTGTHNDEIIQRRGTLNLNRCIIKSGDPKGRKGVNMVPPSSGQQGAVCNIDHCDFWDTDATNSWAVTTTDPCALMIVRNSIFTGEYGLLADVLDTIDSNWNNVFCDDSNYGLYAEAGPNDIEVDPAYIQTDDPSLDTYFALQPYSPVVNADEFRSHMGSRGPMTGYERWPGSLLDGVYGCDFNDFAIFASSWRDNNTIPPISRVVLDDFEDYSATGPGAGTLLDSWEVLTWTYGPTWNIGTSELTLLTDPCDANDGSKAMRWVYDVNVTPDLNEVQYTEILVVLASEMNFEDYNQVKVALKRDVNNSLDKDTFMYAKFLNNIYGNCGDCYTGSDLGGPDKFDVANSVVGGHTLGVHPDEYYDWTINFDNFGGWLFGHSNLKHVGAIMLGIRTQSEQPHGHGEGIIDVDDIRLIDRADCSGNPIGDLAYGSIKRDCEVTFEDVRIFTLFWLAGK